MKHIPNILSAIRIPLSLCLIYLATLHKPALFVCVYAFTALTDMFDGFLARRFHWESKLGSKIDGFADIVLVLSMLTIVFAVLRLRFALYVVVCVGVIALVRGANLVFTRIKFKQWGTMHTFLIRYTSVPIYLIAPVFVVTGEPLNALVMAILAAILASVVEETVILALMEEYNMDMKSAWHAMKARKKA